ncbi:hypothetical protein [Mesorhizobium sp. Root157]|uniref:hypothetical protein n=1 Tax=Mesorhizobium sp. Root157 TaxID=1736477 RepID=UPI0012E36D9E|nr:hypothetical protein [Mesorhizobium sp. Root157]
MVDEFERRYGDVALNRIEAAIAPVLATMLAGLDETRDGLAALDEDYRTNGMQRVDDIINPLIADAQAALALATDQMAELAEFLALKQSVAEKGQMNGYAGLDETGKVPAAQLPAALFGALNYQGVWNASTNSPVIPAASAANKGYFYKVSVAGTTSISGINDWQVGDWIASNGASWDKIDNTDQVLSVAGLVGAITASALKVALGISFADVSGVASAAQGVLATNAMPKSGGAFTGAPQYAADPASANVLARKSYVDDGLATKAGVYTGSTQDETVFPVGHTVFISGGSTKARNGVVTIYPALSGNNDLYAQSGTTALSGTWRARGVISGPNLLAQRTA